MSINVLLVPTIFGYLGGLALIEYSARRLLLSKEVSRKVAHVTFGLLTAFLPLFLGQGDIIFIGGFFAIILLISKKRKILQSIHAVKRSTYGEVYFPVGIALTAFVTLPDKPSFALAMAVLAIADTVAEIFGRKGRMINPLNSDKTVEGTLACFAATFCLGASFMIFTSGAMFGSIVSVALLMFTSFTVSIFEAISTKGFDNIAVPVIAGLLFPIFI